MADPARSAAIIVAAGAGRRFGADGAPKQYREVAGVPVLLRAVRPFLAHPAIGQVVVVLPPAEIDAPPSWLRDQPVEIVAGGAERSDSVRAGLAAVADHRETVLVHDGARPLVTRRLIDDVLSAVDGRCGVIPGLRVTDTVKEVGDDGLVVRTLSRERLWQVQTPQAFPRADLLRLHGDALRVGYSPSDDAGLFERYGLPVRVVAGDPNNLKVTTPADIAFAETIVRSTARSEA